MAVLSKFAQKLVKDGYVARYNSLKNVPVFYKKELDGQLEEYLVNMDDNLINSDDLRELISQLTRNKVLVPNEKYDDLILNTIVSGISKPYPAIIYLIMTEKCNFACDYCFIERYMDQKKTNVMTKEIAKKAIDFWVKQIKLIPERFEEEKSVFFYGGEPLLNFEVVKYTSELINEYKEKGILPEKTSLNMVTNGTCITDEMAKELNRLGIGFSISLDGATCKANVCRKYHDGRLGYEDIIRGLEIAKKNNCDVGFSMTLSQEALEESNTIFELIEKYDIRSMGFNILLTDKTYSVPEEYFIKASEFIVEAFKKFRTMGVYEDRAMRKVKAFVEHRLHFQDCAAEGGNQLVVAPNGEIGICHGYLSTRETFVTNIDDDTFNMRKDSTFNEWNLRTPLRMPKCLDCMALGVCGGGCALNAKANGDSIWDLDERFCIHSKKTLEFLIWDLLNTILKNQCGE